jgi:hypothetical protein
MKQKYFKFTNYLNDIESLNHEEKKSIYDFFEKNYDELEGTFQLIKSHFKNKTNLQDLLIKKVTFL